MSLHRRDFLKFASLAGATAMGSTALGSSTLGGPALCPPRVDELWFINTRSVPCGPLSDSSIPCWQAFRAVSGGPWQQASVADLWAESGDGRSTVCYLHGNRINTSWAMRNGSTAYQALVRPAPESPPPVRFVIWSWPSDRIWRPIKDAVYKARVANSECYKFGWFLGHMPPSAQLGLIGFSYGARIVTGGLHLVAGGSLFGHVLGPHSQPATRTVLWAAASHNYWLNPGQLHGNALYATDALLNLYNSCDPVLHRYSFLDRCARPQALGYTGVPRGWLGANGARFAQRDVCCEVGRQHHMEPYCASPTVMANTRQYVLWQPV
jgi:hypothetical protein